MPLFLNQIFFNLSKNCIIMKLCCTGIYSDGHSRSRRKCYYCFIMSHSELLRFQSLCVPYSRLFLKQRFSHKQWNLNFQKLLYFGAQVDFKFIEKSVSQITCLCLPRTHLLIGMVYDGILSGNPALISGNLDKKKRRYDGPDWSTVSYIDDNY